MKRLFELVAVCSSLAFAEVRSASSQAAFTPLPPHGAGDEVMALGVSGNQLYVGFAFLPPVIAPADSPLAQWDGNSWSSLGAGLQPLSQNLDVFATAGTASNLFVGGQFTTPDGQARNLAVWNGTQWSGLGSGLDNAYLGFPGVLAMAMLGKDLYVGGEFTAAGGQAITNIAKWDGTSWLPLGAGIPNRGGVGCMAVSGNNLYVGGASVLGTPCIAKWDGTNWSTLGSGLAGDVTAIATSGDTVYAAGRFTSGIAKWDGTAWSPLGSGLTLTSPCLSCAPHALAIVGKDLYVGGQFTAAGGVPANGFAKWDGNQWTAINLGVSNPPAVIGLVGTNLLYVGGPFGGGKQYLLRADLSPALPPSLAIALSGNNTATITWPSAPNTNLQRTTDLGSTNWVMPAETVNDNGVNQSILINLSGGHRFFRLGKP